MLANLAEPAQEDGEYTGEAGRSCVQIPALDADGECGVMSEHA